MGINAEYMGRVYLFSFGVKSFRWNFLMYFSNNKLFSVDKNIE